MLLFFLPLEIFCLHLSTILKIKHYSSNKTAYSSFFLIDTYRKFFLNFLKTPLIFCITNNKHRQFTANGIGSCQPSDPDFCCVYYLNISLFLTDRICLANIDKTTRICRRYKYPEDRN